MRTVDFDYNLPDKFIAHEPAEPRDSSKLLVYGRNDDLVMHKKFSDLLGVLRDGDVLVLNQSRVIPARILFDDNGSEREVFILKDLDNFRYQAMVKPGRSFPVNKKFSLNDDVFGLVEAVNEDGTRVIKFNSDISEFGSTPLPPYINNKDVDPEKYQTVYSKDKGSVAAPTAGLHFTDELLEELRNKGIKIEKVILHVGRGTFLPVTQEFVKDHVMHSEYYEMSEKVAERLNQYKSEGKRIVAVGTTSVRVLESSFEYDRGFVAGARDTDIFITPGYEWKVVDALITNFHLPKSTLLMLVSSFIGSKKKMFELYEEAKDNDYRFYSFGDAMFLF